MPENNKRKKSTTADCSKRRKQQPARKKVPESSSKNTRVSRNNRTEARNVRHDNPRVLQPNPRRQQRRTKVYAFLVGGILIILGIILFLMLFTFTSTDLAADAESALNLFGFIGAYLADIMLNLFGLAAFLFSAVCLLMGICSICGRQIDVNATSIIGMIMLILGCSPMAQMIFSESQILEHAPGGVLGTWSCSFAVSHMPSAAFFAICLAVTIFGGLLVTDTSLKAFFLGLWKIIRWTFKTLAHVFAAPFRKRPISVGADVQENSDAAEEAIAGLSDRIFYEDTPSQLLDGKEADLEEREAQARAASEAVEKSENITDLPTYPEKASVNVDEKSEVLPPKTEIHPVKSRIEDASADIDDPDGLLVMEQPEPALTVSTPEPVNSEEKESEKVEKTEMLGDIMARIMKNTPKKRTIKKRSPSVPAIEPEFEYDSILAPEQLSSGQHVESETQNTKVLGNWKPRTIAKKSSNGAEIRETEHVQVEQPTVALSDIHDETARKALSIPAPSIPSHMTKDLLAQLQTEDLEIVSKPAVAVTRLVPKKNVFEALADTADLKSEKSEKPTLEAPKANVEHIEKPKFDIHQDVTADVKNAKTQENAVSAPKADNKTEVPVSAELRALMAEAGFRAPAKKEEDYSEISFDEFEIPQNSDAKQSDNGIVLEEIREDNLNSVRRNEKSDDEENEIEEIQPVVKENAPKMRNSFVVAKEKKRASEDELKEAERARLESKKQAAYEFPPISLLHYDEATQKGLDNDALRLYADKIEEKLAEYHIQGQVVQICPGPIITRFEFQPAPGTKVSKIASLTDDLMMALEIKSVRILAPIPGKGVVGIEIPNEKRNTIYFKEIIASKQFTESKSILTIALGKDPEGEPVVSDLAKMPHLLVAGSTGSGKSVGINTMICSLLYNASPDDVKLILVDPKCLELSIYEGIPHLLVPPITTPAETAAALDWACEEMDERYRKLSALGVRNISGYNEQVQNPTLPKAIEAVRETDADGNPKYTHMPYIVIVVDEFADLMMTAGKEIERSIARLAQKARAAGIHIILATQRPSTNVITGIIKANFPTRLAFRVFSYVDSRTILDQKGAESLLGMGDSLFLPPNTAVLQRVHGAFVSDDEVQAIVGFLAKQRSPEYNLDITTPKDIDDSDDDAISAGSSSDFDPLYDQAVQIVAETRQASASFLQRRMSIGFNRAARIIEQMEREGVVGPQKGQKPREVLIQPI